MITKHGRHYWLDIRVQGRRVRRSLKTGEYRLALARAQEKTRELEDINPRKDISLQEFSRRYLDYAFTQKPASAVQERMRLNKILGFLSERHIVYLQDVTPYPVEQLRTWLQQQGRSRATVNRYSQLLKGMFNRAIDWGLYEGQNPLRKIKFYRENPDVRPLTPYQIRRVLASARRISRAPESPLQRVFFDLCLFALNTGLRKSEILNLRWRDVNGAEIIVRGKGERTRAIPLNDIALLVLCRQVKGQEHVFDIPNRLQPGNFRRTVDLIEKRIKCKFHFHLLRHAFITTLLEKGIDIVTISELAGHSRVSTSLIYSHSDPARKRKAVDILSGH